MVVLSREEEWLNDALITDPLFGLAYLVPSTSCDVATTTSVSAQNSIANRWERALDHRRNAQGLPSTGFWPLDTVHEGQVCT